MRELPILFSTEMVRAILDERKTMTRRVVKPQPTHHYDERCTGGHWYDTGGNNWACSKCGGEIAPLTGNSRIRAPYQPGDILWVQETWKIIKVLENAQMQFEYRADGVVSKTVDFLLDRFVKFKKFADKHGWQSPYFMPKEAARIWLEVTNVRVERVQEITYDDCLREGMWDYGTDVDTLAAFQELWQKLNAKRGYGWDTNPWVWVIEFKRLEVA